MDHWSNLLAYSAHPAILAALAPRIRFYLHKEFRDREIRLYLHKEFRAAEIGFSLHKELHKKMGGDVDENRHFIEEKLVAHVQFFQILREVQIG